jgi:hypothetical protein
MTDANLHSCKHAAATIQQWTLDIVGDIARGDLDTALMRLREIDRMAKTIEERTGELIKTLEEALG